MAKNQFKVFGGKFKLKIYKKIVFAIPFLDYC